MKQQDLLRSLIISLLILIVFSKTTLAYADYELERFKLPGFWHTLRGEPLILEEGGADISKEPFLTKIKDIIKFTQKTDP